VVGVAVLTAGETTAVGALAPEGSVGAVGAGVGAAALVGVAVGEVAAEGEGGVVVPGAVVLPVGAAGPEGVVVVLLDWGLATPARQGPSHQAARVEVF